MRLRDWLPRRGRFAVANPDNPAGPRNIPEARYIRTSTERSHASPVSSQVDHWHDVTTAAPPPTAVSASWKTITAHDSDRSISAASDFFVFARKNPPMTALVAGKLISDISVGERIRLRRMAWASCRQIAPTNQANQNEKARRDCSRRAPALVLAGPGLRAPRCQAEKTGLAGDPSEVTALGKRH